MQKTLKNLSKLLLITAFISQGLSLANAQSKTQKSSSSAAVSHTEVDMQKFKPGVVPQCPKRRGLICSSVSGFLSSGLSSK